MAASSRIIACISDTQAPFAHPDALDFIAAVKKKFSPTDWVHMGDEVDFHGLGSPKYFKDPDGYSPGHEHLEAVLWMKELYKIVPRCKVCISNHTVRPLKRAFEAGIPRAFVREYHEFLEAPAGWRWAEHWEIDGIRFEHGEGLTGKDAAMRAVYLNRQSTVIGHIHTFGGVVWTGAVSGDLFGLNTGCLINEEAYAFKYGRTLRNKPTLGMGLIKHGMPLFIPMFLNKKGRWTGVLP